jgi:stage V sporulation protein B
MTAEGRYPVLEEAAAQAAMGSMYGALGGLLFLLFIFLIFKARSSIFNAPASKITERKITIFKYFMWLVIPVMLSATVSNLRELIDTALFNFLMPLKGYSADYIGIQRGMMTGKYSVLTNMPISALGTLGIMLVPGVASAVTKKDYDGVKMQIETMMKLILMLAIPAAIGLSILGQPVVEWLFAGSPEGGELLRYGSLIVIFYAVSQNAASILQGLDKTKLPVINAVKGTLVSIPVLVICILVLDLKVYAMVASVTVFSFSIAFFNMRSVLKYCHCKINMAHLIVSPTVCAVIMGVFTWAIYHGLYALYPSNTIAILASLGVSVIVYFLLILNSAWFTREQIADLPYGRYMLKLRFKK